MHYQQLRRFGLALGFAIVSSGFGLSSAKAQMAQQELDQNGVAVIAAPYQNGDLHQLLLVEQLSSARACWSEQRTGNFTAINPLLTEFDFTNICGRATDSNGFSIRMGGQDLNWRYSMQVVEKDGDLLLMARSNNRKKSAPDFLIGRVGGTTSGFAKIILEPGWRVTRRIAEGKLTGHFYLTSDRTLEQLVASMQPRSVASTPEMPMAPATTSVPPVATPASAPAAVQEVVPATGVSGVVVPVAAPPAPPIR